MGLAETIARISVDKDRIASDLGMEGSLTNFVNFFQDSFAVTAPYVVNSTRTLGSSFILGHSTLGILGTGLTPQPCLGDSRSAWTTKTISSPDNTFIETFDGSRFINWINTGVGSTYTENTDSSDIITNRYTYDTAASHPFYNYYSFMKFDISAFSGKNITAASLFMKTRYYGVHDGKMTLWYLNTNAVSESDTGSKLIAYPTGSNTTVTTPWTANGQWQGININNLYGVSQTAGSPYLCIRFAGSTYDISTSSGLGGLGYLKMGSYSANRLEFYDKTSSLNYPYLRLVWSTTGSGTIASWGSGSVYIGDGSSYETSSIYMGSSTLSNIELNLTGSTYNNLKLYSSPNGVNWESCNSASVAAYNFTNTGSDLRLRFTASGGNAILTKYECAYGLN